MPTQGVSPRPPVYFFFSSRRRHTRYWRDWSSDVCSSDLDMACHRSQFYKDITIPFYGYNRPGAVISEGIRENWWRQGMMGGIKAQYDCIKALSESEFFDDLKMIDVPVLVMHGEDDQICPFPLTGAR